MSSSIRIRERKRDDDLRISQKEIRFPNGLSFETPTKSFQAPYSARKYDTDKLLRLNINEVSKRFDNDTIEKLVYDNIAIRKTITRKYVDGAINLFIPHLRLYNKLDNKDIRILSNFIYSVSKSVVVIPTVDFSFFKEWKDENKTQKIYSKNNIKKYVDMVKEIMVEINSVGNGKSYMGMIPLMPLPYILNLLSIYQEEGINSFIIDAGTRDILSASLFEYRMILSEINKNVIELHDSFIYAANLGYGLFEKKWTIADDFLSFYAGVDAFGGTFKSRGFQPDPQKPYTPRAKIFSKEEYIYNMSSYKQAEEVLNIKNLNRIKLRSYNENEQINETLNLKQKIGEENMMEYLYHKDRLQEDRLKLDRLRTFASQI